jgi:hypothetical protein
METKKIIEINGIKMEVDLREAKTVDTYKVGDTVKILIPEYGDKYKSAAGVIIGFDDFQSLPTIVVAYLDADYRGAEVKFAYVNSNSKYELAPACAGDIPFAREQVEELLNKNIEAKQSELDKAKWHRRQFNEWFGAYSSIGESAAV